VGKTSLFNLLTGLRQKVGNYPGVTVERREGAVSAGASRWRLLDLPGISSLVPRAPDERLAAEVLTGAHGPHTRPDGVAVVLDASRPQRGLFLASQVMELGLPMVLVLNMADEAQRDGVPVSAEALQGAVGVPVVSTVATSADGVAGLKAVLADQALVAPDPARLADVPGLQGLPSPSPERWSALREVVDEGGLSDGEVTARHAWARRVLKEARPVADVDRRRSDRIDRVLLHPVLGPLSFLMVMGLVFQAVFALADAPIGWIEGATEALGGAVGSLFSEGLLRAFLVDGVVAGVGGVLVFLPQILILFFFIGLLEDSGYMTRAAFLVDRPFRSVGLSGRSFIPLLSSFACAIPGILATRSIEDRRERFITTLVAPLMTCSARLPVYSILIGAFIPEETVLGFVGLRGLLLLGLYLFGIVLGAAAAFVLDRALRRAGQTPTILEMAPYRWPAARSVALRLWHRGGQFVKRAGTVILVMSVVVWALMTFPQTEGVDPEDPVAVAEAQSNTAAGRVGKLMEPVIEPLGYDWRIGVGLLGSLAAREVFVSTMSVVYAVEDTEDEDQATVNVGQAMERARWDGTDRPVYDLATVLSLLVFYAIALQCVSTVAVVYRETGSALWTAGQFVVLTALAWACAWLAYTLAI